MSPLAKNLISLWLILVMFAAAFFVLRPSPQAEDLSFLPSWLSKWLDDNYDLRTFFLAAGVAIIPALVFRQASHRRRVLTAVLVCLLILEFSQLFIQSRSFAVPDVMYTLGGVLAAECLAMVVHRSRHLRS